jgi:hypothetical protein
VYALLKNHVSKSAFHMTFSYKDKIDTLVLFLLCVFKYVILPLTKTHSSLA